MTFRPLYPRLGLFLISFLTAVSILQAQDKKSGPWPQLDNTTVSIPWNDLGKFLEESRKPQTERPPVDYVFSPAVCNVTVNGDRATSDIQCEITVLTEQWALVPIGPAKGGITKVTIDGQPASIVLRDDSLFVLISGGGKKKLAVSAEKEIVSQGGRQFFTGQFMPTPIIWLSVTIPEKNLDVKAPGAATVKVEEGQAKTTISGGYRGGETAAISWQQRAAEPQPSRIYADTNTLVSIEDGLIRFHATVTAQIIPTPAKQLVLSLDPQVTLLDVTGKSVASWIRDPKTGAATVTFDAPAGGEQVLKLVYERDVPEDGGEVPLPVPGVEQSKRDRGTIAIAAPGGFDITPGKTEVARIGLKELPDVLRNEGGDKLQLAYNYLKAPAKLTVTLARPERQPAKIYAQTQTLATVENTTIHCRAKISYSILHAGVTGFRLGLPEGVEILSVEGASVRGKNIVTENGARVLVADLSDLAKGNYALTVDYEKAAKDTDKTPVIPLLTPLNAAQDRGVVGLEVRGGLEVAASTSGAQPMDVKELPEAIWSGAQSPLMLAFKYTQPPAQIALTITKHAQVSILVAMSDVCEASTTVTPDGKCITKLMYVMRNNSKQFMTLQLPEGAQVWSTFVDDQPVAPVRNSKDELLIPLKKSDDVDEDDEESYHSKREQRRNAGNGEVIAQKAARLKQTSDVGASDLKPYDVEVVFVSPAVEIAQKGEIKLGLPHSDVPVGQMAWAVFLPKELLVQDTGGNFKQVPAFSLHFRHFGEVEYERQAQDLAKAAEAQQSLVQAAAAGDAENKAEKSKAVGLLPVRIEIPITGQIQRFEKFLVVDETPQVSLLYRKKVE